MFLSSDEISDEIEKGHLVIDPFEPKFLKTASYVLRLDGRYRSWKRKDELLDAWVPHAGRNHLEPITQADKIDLEPGVVMLASTLEKIAIPNGLVGILSTTSHLARFGVSVNQNSFWISPGFGSNTPTQLTLEIVSFNPSTVRLKSGIPACHLIIAQISKAANSKQGFYKSIYEGQEVPCGPLLFEEFMPIVEKDE